MNGSQSRSQTVRKLVMSRAALWPSASHMVVTNLLHSHLLSSSLYVYGGGDDATSESSGTGKLRGRGCRQAIERISAFVYGGNCRCGMLEWWSAWGKAELRIRIVVRFGIWNI